MKQNKTEDKKESKKIASIAARINWRWLWELIWIFFVVDMVVFSVVAYQMGGREIFSDFNILQDELGFLYKPVFMVQGIILFWNLIFGTIKIRKKMRPIYEMAHTTRILTQQTQFDEVKFHDLESAISKISPTGPDAQLRTGDSDLRGLETAVNNLLTRMRDSYRQQSRFVSDASHELRTPIAVIQGYVNMLDRWGKEDEKVLMESIAAIKSESEHMKRLVEQLLFLARGDSGRAALKFEKFSLSDMIKEVYDEYVMIDTGHTFEIHNPGDIETVGDEAMLKQSVRILADNAVKYSPKGETITFRVGKKAEGETCFSVQDSGIGIHGEDIPHVFERFFRSDSSRTRESGGTGLGLSIAKWIIDKHGGYFDILSRDEIGTRITVNIPNNVVQ